MMGKSGVYLDWQIRQAVVIDVTIHKHSPKQVAKNYEINQSTVYVILNEYKKLLVLRKKFYGTL